MRTFALAVVLILALSGCIGLGAKEAPASTQNATNATHEARNITLPDRAGVCNGCAETNKTENGTGGLEHKHDYWKGKEQVIVFSNNVFPGTTPVFPDGQGSSPKGVAYVKLGKLADNSSALVYEGTEKVTIRATPIVCTFSVAPCQPDPNAPQYSIQYRSAADSKWREPLPLAPGASAEIKVKPAETDMPHSVLSLWVFRVTTDKPVDGLQGINLTITVVKGRDVVNWPGHPNFYADSDVRVVANSKPVKTHMSGIAGSFLYDQGGTWAMPDKLISYGTSKLIVIVNVTGITSQTGQTASGYFLEVHNATIIGPEVTFGSRFSEKDKKNDLKTYTFEVPVFADGMDGPYQPDSRWGFRAMATFADVAGVVGLCPGCFDYDIEYTLTVIAIHYKDAPGIMMM